MPPRRFPLAAGRLHTGDPQTDEVWREIKQIIDYLGDMAAGADIEGVTGNVLLSDGDGGIDALATGSAGKVLTVSGGLPTWQTPTPGMVPAGNVGDVQTKATATTLAAIAPVDNKVLIGASGAWVAGAPGSDHQVITNAGGLLSGVSPSTAGKVLLSDGTDWTAGAPGSDHGAIVRSGSVLSSVAPGSANNVLTSNGTDWTSSVVPTSPLGWQTAYDVDFTTLGTLTVSGNGNFTVDGKTWVITNFASATTMSVSAALGMYMKHGATTTVMSMASNTAPNWSSPTLDTFLSGLIPDDCRFGIRLSFYILASTRTVSNDASLMMLSTTDYVGHRSEVEVYNKAGVQTDWMRLGLNSSSKTAADIGTVLASHNCWQIECPYFGADSSLINSGIYSSGFPTKWFRRAYNQSAAGVWVNTPMNAQSTARIVFAAVPGSSAGTTTLSIGRLKIEYYRYY